MAIYKREGKKKTTYYLCYYDDEGKQVWKSFDKKKDAETYEAKVKVSKKENRYHEVFDVRKESTKTFNDLLKIYEENFKGQKSYKTKVFVIKGLRETFGDRKLEKIKYLDLETYRNRRKATLLKSGKPRSDATVNYEMAVFVHILNKGIDYEMLKESPFDKKSRQLKFKVDNARIRYLNESENEALMQAIEDLKIHAPHLRAIVEVALLTGFRRGELLSLKWEDIKGDFIYLKGDKTKSAKGRQFPINEELAGVLREVRRINGLKSEFVFCNDQGDKFHDVRSSFDKVLRRARIEDFRFHDLRHTYASHFMMQGGNLTTLSKLLGHASLAMTLRYAHFSKDHFTEAMAGFKMPGISKTLKNPSDHKKEASQIS